MTRRILAYLILAVLLAALAGIGSAAAEGTAAAETAEQAGSELPEPSFPYELVETVPAEDANAWWAEQGYDNPPYLPGSVVYIIRLTEDTVFSRVYDGEISGMYGGWIMEDGALEGLTPDEIRDRFALPAVPAFRVDVVLPAGTLLRRGICNSLEEWGNGGGIQYDMMGERIGEFINDRPLEEEETEDGNAA